MSGASQLLLKSKERRQKKTPLNEKEPKIFLFLCFPFYYHTCGHVLTKDRILFERIEAKALSYWEAERFEDNYLNGIYKFAYEL